MKSDKFECGDFTRENMPVQLLLAQVGHMYKWYVTKQMKDTELKAGQAGILAILQMVGPMSQRELADHIHITPPSVNVAVQKLEKLGYIRKEQDEKDQRMTRIHLTERGEKILGNMHEILRSTEDTLLKNMSKTLTVPTGYYYRVGCVHYANSDVSDSYTDGIYI